MEFTAETFRRRISRSLASAGSASGGATGLPGGGSVVELADLLTIPENEGFVREAYRRILGREHDLAGYVHFLGLLRVHVPRRVILYQLANSEEARRRGVAFAGLPPGPRDAGRRLLGVLRSPWSRLLSFLRRVYETVFQVRRFELLDRKLDLAIHELSTRLDHISLDLAESNRKVLEALATRSRQVVTCGNDVVVTEVDGFLLGVPAEDWRRAAFMTFRGWLEPGLARRLEETIRPGMTVVDVGAHVGYYSLLAARRVGPSGRVISFEPTPRIFRLLAENIQVNGFREAGTVSLHAAAVGETGGRGRLAVYPGNSGHNSLFPKAAGEESVEVTVVGLDEALVDLPAANVVKIDAEGAEPFVLRGMRRLIGANPELQIFIEFAPEHLRRAGVDPLEFLDEIESMDLEFMRVDDKTGELSSISRTDLVGAFSVNLRLAGRSAGAG